METVNLTKHRARAIILHAAGLTGRNQFGKGIDGAYKVIEQLGFIQVDTNYVVERAHHHAIWTRVADYNPQWLEDLQADGRIYEFWTRDSGFMPMNEFRFSIPIQQSFIEKYKSIPAEAASLMRKILDRISREGPLGAKDFENDRIEKSSGWWDWRPSKVALERLHFNGELLTTRKKDFHKLYDLTRNIIPVDTDKCIPSLEEYTRHLILRSLNSLGIAYPKEISWNGRFVKPPVKDTLQKLVDAGEVCSVSIDGLKGPLYMLPRYRNKKINIACDAFILSPFDILNVFRHRLRDFFNYDYQVECFVPEAKRKYGYFSLPILIGDRFVARMDAKADRKQQILIIHNIHFEPGQIPLPELIKLRDTIQAFATFNKCNSIVITKSNNKPLLKIIREANHVQLK